MLKEGCVDDDGFLEGMVEGVMALQEWKWRDALMVTAEGKVEGVMAHWLACEKNEWKMKRDPFHVIRTEDGLRDGFKETS